MSIDSSWLSKLYERARVAFNFSNEAVPIPISTPTLTPSSLSRTPHNPIYIGQNCYELSGKTDLIKEALRPSSLISYKRTRGALIEIESIIHKNPNLILASTQESAAFEKNFYNLHKGLLTLYSKLQSKPELSFADQALIDDLGLLERKAVALQTFLPEVKKGEWFLYPFNRKNPYLMRKICFQNLFRHGERVLCENGLKADSMITAPSFGRISFFSKRFSVSPFVSRFSSVFKNSKEIIADQLELGLRDMRMNPVTVSLAVVATAFVIFGIAYWASGRGANFFDED